MEIRRLFNITKNDISKNNIMVPICVWNKFFLEDTKPTKNIEEYIKRALENTKEKVIVIVVDEIQINNRIVRNNSHNLGQNQRRLMRKWIEIKNNIQEIINSIPENQQKNIEVIWWHEYAENDPYCKKTTNFVYNKFENNIEFRNEILRTIKTSITDKKFSEEEYLTLCRYVLDEFSIVYHWPTYKNIHYWLYMYPFTDEVLESIEKIKSWVLFPEIKKELDAQQISVILLN